MGVTDSSSGCCNQTLSLEDSFKESNHILKQQAKLRGLQASTSKHGKMSTNYIHGRGSIDDYATTSASEGDYDEIEGSVDPEDSYSGDGIVILDPTLNSDKEQNHKKIPPAFSSNLSVSQSNSKEVIQDELIANLNKQYQEKLNEHKLEAAMLQKENERLRQQNKLLKTKYSLFNEKHKNKKGHKNNDSLPLKLGKQYRARIQPHPHPGDPRGSKVGSRSDSQLHSQLQSQSKSQSPSSHKRKLTPFKPALRINLPSVKNQVINKSAPISLGQSKSTISRTPKHEPVLRLHTKDGKIGYDSLHETQKSAPISADYYYNDISNQKQQRRSQVISPLVLPLPPLKESSFPIESKSHPIVLASAFADSPDESDNEEWTIHPDPHNDAPFKPPLALTRSCSESADLVDDASAQIEDHKNSDDNENLAFDIDFDGNCDSLMSCVAIRRIIETLKWYSNCNGDADMLFHKIRDQNYGYNLIKDYHHIMKKHLDSKSVDKIRAEIQTNVKQCRNTKCGGYQRKCVENQQKNEDDKKQNNHKRGRKRKRNKDKKHDRHEHIPFYVECMDTIHCYFMHNLITVNRD